MALSAPLGKPRSSRIGQPADALDLWYATCDITTAGRAIFARTQDLHEPPIDPQTSFDRPPSTSLKLLMDQFAPPPAFVSTPSLHEFTHHALAQRRGASLVAASVFGTALVIAALLSPTYRASAILAVLPSPEFTVRSTAGSHDVNASALALDQIMKTETEILGSDDLHAATLSELGPISLYPDVFSPAPKSLSRRLLHTIADGLLSPWRTPSSDESAARQERGLLRFRSNLQVLPARDANIITVTFDSRSASNAAAVITTMLRLYAAQRTRLYDDPQLEIVRREAESGGRAVANADHALAEFKRDHLLSDFDQERSLLLRRRSQADQSVADAEASIAEYRARLVTLGRALQTEPATVAVFIEKDPDTRLLAINAALSDLRAKLASARQKYLENSRFVTELRAQLASRQSEMRRLSDDTGPSVVRHGRNPILEPVHLDMARAEAELAAAQALLASVQFQDHAVAAALVQLDAEASDLALLQRRRDSADQNYRDANRILAERHLSEAEDARRMANVRVVQPAIVPQTPRALPLLVVAAGFVAAILAACAWVVGVFILRPVFLTSQGLEAATGLPVLAVFRATPGRTAEALLSA